MSRPIRVPTVPGSDHWRALRRTGVGASDVPIITGDSRFGDVASLYAEKLGYAADPVETDFMASGHWLEDLIARWWAKETGHPVRRLNALLRNRERPWMIATPDRSVPGVGLLEVKVTDHPGDRWGTPGTDQIPDDVLEQVQWQAAVADVETVDIAVFFTRTRRRERYTVGRDAVLIEELTDYGAAFWRCVETRTPPEPAGRAVRALLRDDEVEADAELTTLVQGARVIRDDLVRAEKSKDEIDALIKARLDRVGGARGDGFRVHYRPNADGTRTDWEAVARAYRAAMLAALDDPEMVAEETESLDQIGRDLTQVVPGARPLRLTFAKTKEVAA